LSEVYYIIPEAKLLKRFFQLAGFLNRETVLEFRTQEIEARTLSYTEVAYIRVVLENLRHQGEANDFWARVPVWQIGREYKPPRYSDKLYVDKSKSTMKVGTNIYNIEFVPESELTKLIYLKPPRLCIYDAPVELISQYLSISKNYTQFVNIEASGAMLRFYFKSSDSDIEHEITIPVSMDAHAVPSAKGVFDIGFLEDFFRLIAPETSFVNIYMKTNTPLHISGFIEAPKFISRLIFDYYQAPYTEK
jgi:hypothetical protein